MASNTPIFSSSGQRSIRLFTLSAGGVAFRESLMSVPGERFELPTNGLQNRCSTTELTRHTGTSKHTGRKLPPDCAYADESAPCEQSEIVGWGAFISS